jgi:SAM-dependent methyltransferase
MGVRGESRDVSMANPSTSSNARILARCGQMTDHEWFDLLDKSAENKPTEGIELPGFPPEEFQRSTIGNAGPGALIEGQRFYTLIKQYAHRLGVSLDPQETTILDFGCGWGRMTRFFLKDVAAENLHGVDVIPFMIQTCKSMIPHGNFSVVTAEPPTSFAANSFDIIFAYSVFSHLAENVHIKWIEEFSRLLKPGGLLVVTTQPRRFLDLCESLRGEQSGWHKCLANSFLDINAAYADYDNGKFLYSPTGGEPPLDPSFYGEALIPPQYVEREWTKYLRFCDFFDDVNVLFQAVVVMQKADDYS